MGFFWGCKAMGSCLGARGEPRSKGSRAGKGCGVMGPFHVHHIGRSLSLANRHLWVLKLCSAQGEGKEDAEEGRKPETPFAPAPCGCSITGSTSDSPDIPRDHRDTGPPAFPTKPLPQQPSRVYLSQVKSFSLYLALEWREILQMPDCLVLRSQSVFPLETLRVQSCSPAP